MSTPNFKSNSRTVFAFHTSYEDEETKEFVNDEFIFDDMQENVFSELQADKTLNVDSVDRYDDDRSYGGKIFAEVCKNDRNVDFYAEAELIIRDGYYGDGNLDYSIYAQSGLSGERYELDEFVIDDLVDEFERYTDSVDMRVIKPLFARITKDAEALKTKIEKVYTDYTEPLIVRGIFSNGEAVYEKKTLTTADLRG